MYRICKYCGRLASMFYRYLSSYVITINLFSAHLDYFSDNFVVYSKQQGECFDQDILTI